MSIESSAEKAITAGMMLGECIGNIKNLPKRDLDEKLNIVNDSLSVFDIKIDVNFLLSLPHVIQDERLDRVLALKERLSDRIQSMSSHITANWFELSFNLMMLALHPGAIDDSSQEISQMARSLGFQESVFDGILEDIKGASFTQGLVKFYETAITIASSEEGKDEKMVNGHIFISYAREDMAAAKKIYQDLKMAKLNPWLDIHNLSLGIKWRSGIERALKGASYCLLLLSTSSVSKRGYVQKETKIALDIVDEHPETTAFLIPVRLEECNPTHRAITEINWVDLFPSWDEGISRIISTVKGQAYEVKQKYKFGALLFGLGNHIAMLGWVKIANENRIEMDNMLNRILTIIRTIELPNNIDAVINDFYKNKKKMDNSGDPTKSAGRMLHLRNLLSITIGNKLDDRSEKIFSFGFVLTNVIYMCEQPEIVLHSKDYIIENLGFLENVSAELCLSPNTITEIISKAKMAVTHVQCKALYDNLVDSLKIFEKSLRG
jgi:hypothetical protein